MTTAAQQPAPSRTAILHGLSGTRIVLLPSENRAALEALAREYLDEWRPRTSHETFLVTQMVQARWRLNRIARMEAELMDALFYRFGEGQSDDGALVIADAVTPGPMRTLQRSRQDAERSYHRAVRELRSYRAERAKQPNTQPLPSEEAEIQNEPKSCPVASQQPSRRQHRTVDASGNRQPTTNNGQLKPCLVTRHSLAICASAP